MLLKLLEKLGRKRIIYDREGTLAYMYRYYLIFPDKTTDKEDSSNIPFNLMLHKICLSDPDELHDHPWWYATLILKGGYWEITPQGRFWRNPGHFRISNPKSLHRLEIPDGSDGSWSLFFRGPKVREWGFIFQGKWINHRQYLQSRQLSQSK
ncbi:hypothetical protein [Gloeothece verrucosa]|uniref:AraC-type arabinose-binding/dimerisation domain-containing protein n=1 Tax=Gloeothece verrucosa (strain PCC 7822) TaxID=497965 RepID=E0U5C8_GLOV7|nr:hypothetical protein [Gloeothece verrucosa]ADN13518.1 conserved hypothetical protein [Gloeothece verrucosa PCC 7822]